jgi:hypothetical protein
MAKDNKEKKDQVKKLLLFEPNPDDNSLIPNENLTISVDLKTTRKGRSVISIPATGVGKITNNNNDKSSTTIGFIDGTPIGKGKRALTTNYTEANSDLSVDGENDLESLGIESINIEFDTAYTPMIKIKFIDIRGQAVFQQGVNSKYKMFFELPYPIFDLTVKGFFGKPVKYCLHLIKWNSAFNSSTGNFEIDAEFIGYTYALLTDLLMGLIRAVVYTPEGKPIFDEFKEEWAKEGNTLTTIDEMLSSIQQLGDEFDKIKESDGGIQQIKSSVEVFDLIELIEGNINELKKNIVSDPTVWFTHESGVLCTDKTRADTSFVEIALKRFKEKVTSDLTRLNKNIQSMDSHLKINESEINDIRVTRGITVDDLKNKTTAVEAMFNITKVVSTPGLYDKTAETTNGSNSFNLVGSMMETVIANVPNISTLTSSEEIVIYDLRASIKELNRVKKELKNNNKILREETGKKLKNIAKSKLNFDPTIYNVFSILTVHCEVLLKTISKVSKAAENSTSRYGVLDKLTKDSLNSKNTNQTIFAWPEYRKDSDVGFKETWLASDLTNGEALKVNEIVFIEHLLEELMNLVKRDDALFNLDDTGNSQAHFWPVSTLDIPINYPTAALTLPLQSPYTEALISPDSKTTPQEATRCLLMRAFLGLSIAQNGGMIDKDIEFKGVFEAENLYRSILIDVDRVRARDIIGGIVGLGYGEEENSEFNSSVASKKLIEEWKVGYATEVKNPYEGAVPLLQTSGSDSLSYSYIFDKTDGGYGRSYIPISGNFSGQGFYESPGKLKSQSDIFYLGNNHLFTGSGCNDAKNRDSNDMTYNYPNDGAIYLKILSKDNYEKGIITSPQYGADMLLKYQELLDIKDPSPITQTTIGPPTYLYKSGAPNNYGISPINNHGGLYKAACFKFIKFNGETGDKLSDTLHYKLEGFNDKDMGNVLCSYWNGALDIIDGGKSNNIQYYCGNYLAKSPTGEVFNNQNIDWDNDEQWIYGNNSTYNILRDDLPEDYGNTRELIGDLYGDKEGYNAESVYLPYIEFSVCNTNNAYHHFSLFGSKFYNQQTTNEAKCLLFLHSFPWQGYIGDIGNTYISYDQTNVSLFDIWNNMGLKNDDTYTVKGLYRNNSAFIKAPKLWCAFIGSLLYSYSYLRDNQGKQLIDYGSYSQSSNPPFTNSFPWQDSESYLPDWSKMLYDTRAQSRAGMNFMMDGNNEVLLGVRDDEEVDNRYALIEYTLTGLPQQVKEEFIKCFEEFCYDDKAGFIVIQKEFQLVEDELELKEKWDELINHQADYDFVDTDNKGFNGTIKPYRGNNYLAYKTETRKFTDNDDYLRNWVKVGDLKSVFPNKLDVLKNYEYITAASNHPWNSYDAVSVKTGGIYQLNLKLKSKGSGQNAIKALIKDYVYINNAAPRVFNSFLRYGKFGHDTDSGGAGGNDGNTFQGEFGLPFKNIEVETTKMELFLDGFFKRFKTLTDNWSVINDTKDDEIQNRLFNTIDDDTIKLNLYRTIGSIHNKWVAGTDNPFSNCGFSNSYDKKVAKNKRNSSNVHLIDSFRFLDRAFNDIGNDFIINPLAISSMLLGNYNQSFFDVANKILIDNNFNFIALPTFVNFNNDQELADMFKPYQHKDVNTASGPSFVCVYVGQTSKHLDLGNESDYDDDGIIIKVDSEGKYIDGAPSDFVRAEVDDGSLNIPYFLVSYGHSNQSFFKDIRLDQKEFVETAESLQIIEDISQQGDNRKPNSTGQNLFNVYQTRSYSAEVEMMGNAMIQPMMYFQLNNIPMFRGAYMIIKTSHNITAHNMTTKFTGVRVKKTKTPLVEASTIFMNILGSLNSSDNNENETERRSGRDVPFDSQPNPGGVIIN